MKINLISLAKLSGLLHLLGIFQCSVIFLECLKVFISTHRHKWSLSNFLLTLPGLMCHKALSAIISKSPQKLQKVLERDANINGRNLWGQTALHLSACWAEGVSIMIRAGGDIDCVDNRHNSPIYYAAGAQCLEAVDLLLQENCALIFRTGGSYPRIRSVLWDVLDTSENIQSRIVSDLERRLNRLRNLDICHLSPNLFESISCQTFGPYTLAILASTGLEKANFVKNWDTEIREDHIVFSGHASIYHGGLPYLRPGFLVDSDAILWEIKSHGGDVEKRALSIFDKLYSAGFTSLDGYNSGGYTILQILCLTGKLNGILWLLQKLQATPNGIRDSGANAMHCIAENMGVRYWRLRWKDDQIEQTLRQLRLSGVDPLAKCCSMCACLVDGNSPTATLTRTLCQSEIQGIERRDFLKSRLRVWDAAIEGCSITSEQTYRQLVLSETFTRLGLTHTCSNRAYGRNLKFRGRRLEHLCYINSRDQESIDDVMEIQEEEKELIQQLDYWMSQYEVERATFDGTVEQFFDIWWERLPDHEPDFFSCPSPDYRPSIAWEVEVESDSD
jgi:ankyrin repeat protein